MHGIRSDSGITDLSWHFQCKVFMFDAQSDSGITDLNWHFFNAKFLCPVHKQILNAQNENRHFANAEFAQYVQYTGRAGPPK